MDKKQASKQARKTSDAEKNNTRTGIALKQCH